MAQILTPQQVQQPRLVTLAELRAKLLPYCWGWPWAEDAIVDLWKLGAPVPGNPHEPERRILLPGQFAKWWGELAQRMGYPGDANAAYQQVSNVFRASAGPTKLARHPRNAGG